ncbi:uncharacterized protein TNCV_2492021 [Trichonephila clavipes]|nr:uncharacterized protein TNCV_2492021 [Trichonephila clavipes]
MAQRKHLEDFYVVELLDDWNVDVPSWKYPSNLESPRVSSPGFGNASKMMCCMKGNTRNRWRDGPVCPAVDKELWRLGPDGSGVFWRVMRQ